MSNNLDSDKSVPTGKMYPIDLAPQKITIVKGVSNSDVKMAHLLSAQTKTSSGQPGPHSSGLMRSSLAQIISSNTSSQAQMIVSGSPILQGGQIVSQGAQLHGAGAQLVAPAAHVLAQGSARAPRPAGVQLSAVSVATAANILVSKGPSHAPPHPPSHVPRGLAAGASLAVRPAQPALSAGVGAGGGGWGAGRGGGRGAVVYGGRQSTLLTVTHHAPPAAAQGAPAMAPGGGRGARGQPAVPRPLPLLQRNYQAATAAPVVAGKPPPAVGNSAPAQLYYEVSRAAPPATAPAAAVAVAPIPAPQRPSILRKREAETGGGGGGGGGWEDVEAGGSAGSTTVSASSSPQRDEEPKEVEVSPRKKPRKQTLKGEGREWELGARRPQLGAGWVCGWRGTALHFVRPADVRRRDPAPPDINHIASQKHVLSSADGWKVHHLTAQMEDLMSLEADVGAQLAALLRSLETAGGRALGALQPQAHTLLELLKGNIQRSRIVCEGVEEARADILRVFTHRTSVADILARQADKRCFRKHRSQS